MAAGPVEQTSDAQRGFDHLLGFELIEVSATAARAQVRVRDELKQPYGLLHGGVYASLAESLASWATAVGVGEGCIAVGLANSTSFLRPITEGTVHASAERLHGGRTTWVWDVQFRDDAERLCAITRMTIAVREQPLSGS
jgi:1,4-dihydroxy-2-naphthoyl-CoA hydrolase